MSIEASIAGLLRGFLCRESPEEWQTRGLIERLWDLSRTEAQASFLRAVERGEDDVHHLHEWEELLGLVGSRQRFIDLQFWLDNVVVYTIEPQVLDNVDQPVEPEPETGEPTLD